MTGSEDSEPTRCVGYKLLQLHDRRKTLQSQRDDLLAYLRKVFVCIVFASSILNGIPEKNLGKGNAKKGAY